MTSLISMQDISETKPRAFSCETSANTCAWTRSLRLCTGQMMESPGHAKSSKRIGESSDRMRTRKTRGHLAGRYLSAAPLERRDGDVPGAALVLLGERRPVSAALRFRLLEPGELLRMDVSDSQTCVSGALKCRKLGVLRSPSKGALKGHPSPNV